MTHPNHLEPLGLSIDVDREAIARNSRNRVNLVAEITAADAAVDRVRAPMSAVFVLDTSGSMAGSKLEHVLRSTERLVELLGAEDRAGVVCFSNHAQLVSPLRA